MIQSAHPAASDSVGDPLNLKLHEWRTEKARQSEVRTKETASLHEGLRRMGCRKSCGDGGRTCRALLQFALTASTVIEELRYEKWRSH